MESLHIRSRAEIEQERGQLDQEKKMKRESIDWLRHQTNSEIHRLQVLIEKVEELDKELEIWDEFVIN